MFKAPLDLSQARVLISNDDGIHATGIKVLEEAIRPLVKEVWVVAPESEQSGAGHSLTLRNPLRYRKVKEFWYAVDGTPTDSVLVAARQILKNKQPDLILSGINRGANLGEDVTYSGTIAGAMEGVAARRGTVRFVVGAEDARARVAEHYGIDSMDSVEVVPECIDVLEVRGRVEALDIQDARLRMGLHEHEHAVVCLTAFHDEAFVEAILGGFSMARVERQDLRLFLLGAGPAETHARWRAEQLHLGDSVIFHRDPDTYPGLLAAATAVVDAMPWPGPSRGALEAAASGVPVLRWEDGHDVGDPDSVPARIASSPERFAGELMRFVHDPSALKAVAEGSAALARQSDVSTVAERWADFYDEVIVEAMRGA